MEGETLVGEFDWYCLLSLASWKYACVASQAASYCAPRLTNNVGAVD